jgi:hypothetical protein
MAMLLRGAGPEGSPGGCVNEAVSLQVYIADDSLQRNLIKMGYKYFKADYFLKQQKRKVSVLTRI